MERTHTPTPWKADPGDTSVWWAITTGRSGEVIADLSDSAFCAEDDALNARRIVTCVNACAGIEDPAATLAEVRGLLARLNAATGNPALLQAIMVQGGTSHTLALFLSPSLE